MKQSNSRWVWPLRCSNCGRGYPDEGLPYCCPVCGGTFDLADPIIYKPSGRQRVGLERYRASFPLPEGTPLPSLGEGDTPLLEENIAGRRIYLKCEHLNPSGSFKDRGTVVLVAALRAASVTLAVEDSSGNAGSSFAAYAARSGLQATVYIPEYASGPKRAQIEAYGANVISVPGPRSAATQAALQAAGNGATYASHTYLPQVLAGLATVAFEIVEQLGKAPGAVVFPAGQGTQLLGAFRGFQALTNAGAIERLPQLVAVQASACAPLWAVSTGGAAALALVQEGETQAEGIRILHPLRGDAVLEAIDQTAGCVLAVEEEDITSGQAALASRGHWVEPTSAVVWPALEQILGDLPDPVVVVLTGSGFKTGH